MKLTKKHSDVIATLRLNFHGWIFITLEYGTTMGFFTCYDQGKRTAFTAVAKGKDIMKVIAEMSPLNDYLNHENAKYILLITANPFIKNIKTHDYLIKQEAIFEHELQKMQNIKPIYTLKLAEADIDSWFKLQYQTQYQNHLSCKENKYNVFKDKLFKDSTLNVSYELCHHATDCFALMLYFDDNDETIIKDIRPIDQFM